MKQLLIGAGNSRVKKIETPDRSPDWDDLTTLDFDAASKPDIEHDLNALPLPFGDDTFDEIHAYCVLEHCGRQGDFRFFFDQWAEFWRILKPDGRFYGQTPFYGSKWAWGDPSHSRIVSLESLVFLSQQSYREQVGKTAMTDFRSLYTADFEVSFQRRDAEHDWFILRAIKP